jgi:hypothetical protein
MNKVLLSEDKLQLILERHKDQIGNASHLSDIITGATFFISTLAATYNDFLFIRGVYLKICILVVAVLLTFWGVLMEINNRSKKFDNNMLFEEMKANNEIEHPFSIVAIKDTFRDYPNKYLVYYDNRWSCWFFMNFKTKDNQEANISNIKQGISSKLKVDIGDIEINYKAEEMHHKHSESDDIDKWYHHSLYSCYLQNFREELEKDDFSIDDVKYKWMTIDEMEKNPSIKKHNMDVVEFVKNYC